MIAAKDNPFRVERVHALRFEPSGCSRDALSRRLAALRYRAAIVGPHGSGKTTLMLELAEELRAAGMNVRRLQLSRGKPPHEAELTSLLRFAAKSTPRQIIMLDGADLLPRRTWAKFRGCTLREDAGGLIITTHRSQMMPTLIETRTSAALLERLVRRLIGEAAESLDIESLYERHGGNLRDALRELYDRCADQASSTIA